ncbi:MAG: hypothetical protein KUG65_07085 [Sphingomonadaceae bacterium]|nr:hypothetical protein [Sphingomonadaceae bacterium]
MTQRENPDIPAMIAGALDWWRDAGVDYAFVDGPVHWNEPEKEAQPSEAEALPARPKSAPAAAEPADSPVTINPASLPQDLQSFTQWWLNEPALADGPTSLRIPPRGGSGAELMVIVPEPESGDRDRLLTGPQGRLLDAMLTAFGINEDKAYIASALPRHLPAANWEEMASRGTGAVLSHHIALAAPKRLAIFGASVLPLIGNDPPQGPANLRVFNYEGLKVPMLASRSLAALLEQPRWKARIWQAWLDWHEQ